MSEKAERIVKKILRLDASGVYELLYRRPKDEREAVYKAYALMMYAKVLSSRDLERAYSVALEAIRTLPDKRPEELDEVVIRTLAHSLRILSVYEYKRGNLEESKKYLEEVISTLEKAKSEKAFLLRAKAYRAALFGGEFDEEISVDVRDPVSLSHALAAALALKRIDIVEDLLRKALLRGTLVSKTNEIVAALEALYERPSKRAREILAFFDPEIEAEGEIARFAKYRDNRKEIRERYKGTSLEILSLLEEAREDPKYATMLLKRLQELDLAEEFRRIVSAEAHIILGLSFLESGLYKEALSEALKAREVENIDLLVSAYRLALEAALKVDKKLALEIIDEAYERLKDYRSYEPVSRLIDVMKKIRPLLLYESGKKIEALIEALKTHKKK